MDWLKHFFNRWHASKEGPQFDEDGEPRTPVATDEKLEQAVGPEVSEQRAEKDDKTAEGDAERPESPLERGAPSFQEPPSWPGIYRIRYRGPSRKIMYIGIAVDLRNRKKQHIYGGRCYERDHYFYWQKAKLNATGRTLVEAEIRHIARHSPPGNKRAGGGGPMEAPIDRRLEVLRLEALRQEALRQDTRIAKEPSLPEEPVE